MPLKKVLAFRVEGCPYCRQAMDALKELAGEDSRYESVSVEWIEENQFPEISRQYDYYYTPSMFIEGRKIYEAHPGEGYQECREKVKGVLDAALA